MKSHSTQALGATCPFLSALLVACTARTPPIAAQRPFVIKSLHGERVDEYYWMRDDDDAKKSPEIMAHLNAEQAYATACLQRLAPLQETLVAEMRGRIKEDDSTVPAFDRGYWYWQSFDLGGEYPRHLRQQGSALARDSASPTEVVLDCPSLAKDHEYFRIGSTAVSNDGQWIAWTQDTAGRRTHALRVKNLRTGETLADEIAGVLEPVEWAADNRTIFYVRQDPVLLQSGPVYRHEIGTPVASDTLVYDEPDKTLSTSIRSSASHDWLLIDIDGYDTTELRAVAMAQPASTPRVIIERTAEVRSYADHLNARWVIRTNLEARNFRLVQASEAAPSDSRSWQDIVAHREDVGLDEFVLLDGALAIVERVEANARVRVIPWSGGVGFTVPCAESAFKMSFGENLDASNPALRVVCTSMITPDTTIDVDLKSGACITRKVRPVIGYDASLYVTTRIWAPARDGKLIPISLAWRREAYQCDGNHPIVIEGYGAYGLPTDAEFSNAAICLMDRGVAVALAHVRGGCDLGQEWYEDGRMMNKRNTFNDFVDATDELVRANYAAKDRVFATGGSAGGLLMGAVANEAGERYRGIALNVPFVDALTTMLDETIPLTTNEWTQWGDPREAEAYQYIRSYSPYDNLSAKPYPAMLVTTGLWDSQVQYYEPAKYVARCRRLRTDSNAFIFHINMEAGHGGNSGRFRHLKEAAREQAFFLDLAGITRLQNHSGG